MDPSEYYTYEDRAYINPTLSRDEQLGFVDTLRDTIKDNTAQINTQTRNLGTNITPNYGGLTGSNSYFAQRYQTTPVEAQVKTLKATAQAKALNDLMTNYQNQAQNRYNQAYRNYNKRNSSGGGGTKDYENGEVEFEPTDDDNLYVDPNDIVVQEPNSNASDVVSNSSLYGGNPGGRQYGSSVTPYYYTLDGDSTAFTVNKTFWGSGIDTPMKSYGTKESARAYLQDIIKRGGKIYNQYGKDITWNALAIMGLY